MEYHVPDARWAIFGMPDFESYNNKLVVKGLFHSGVPKDVLEAYKVAEYIMAHAYYHYTLYEEAFSKLLLIFEMAIKLRCGQMGITLNTITVNKKTQEKVTTDKKLKTLIDELSVKIDLKDIEEQLQILREIRNTKMHPITNGVSGAISFKSIKISVVLLNKLFLHEQKIKNRQLKTVEIETVFAAFKMGNFVLEREGKRFLSIGILILDSVQVDEQWFHLMVCFPVIEKLNNLIVEKKYPNPFIFTISNIVLEKNRFSAIEIENNKPVKFYRTNNPLDLGKFSNFHNEIIKVTEDDRIIYDSWVRDEINWERTDFLYQWLWRVK